MLEVTRIRKHGGPLTKQISLRPDGTIFSDGSSCVMSRGSAERVRFTEPMRGFADLIHSLEPSEAVALGTLRPGLPDAVSITTQDKLAQANGSAPHDLIARNGTHIVYRPDMPALALIDIDTKGMPDAVRDRIREAGGFWPALLRVVPAMGEAPRVVRKSTSAGIIRTDTGASIAGSNGRHIFLHVRDGGDVERFLRTLHERCWLHGLGWHMVGAGGQLLDRSLVDRMVYSPERLVFEGAPVLSPPLYQDHAARAPEVHDGEPLDTAEACPSLTIVETSAVREAKAKSGYALDPERAKSRDAFIARHAARIMERTGATKDQAEHIVRRQTAGIILPTVALEWDDDDFAGCTCADILADPARFDGATLADPLEGIEYGRNKAKVLRRPDGSPWIYSLAHGRTIYSLKFDASAVQAVIADTPSEKVPAAFVSAVTRADLSDAELDGLKAQAVKKSGVGKAVINAAIKAALGDSEKADKAEAKIKRLAERKDLRPQIPAPPETAEWLPQVKVLNDILGASKAPEPPMRDLEGVMTCVRVRRIPEMHALTAETANGESDGPEAGSGTEQPLLQRMDEMAVAEMIERHIEYVNKEGEPVHLLTPFVKHYVSRADGELPTVSAIATLPIVLPDGTLLSKRGLDRKRGLIFRIPRGVASQIPAPGQCDRDAVAEAMRLLCEDWLCDVATDYPGKCVLIAAALTVIERAVLRERPAFFVTAGRRGGGKTTVLMMLMMAATGARASASAWSPNEEERRKSILSYLLQGVPAIVWDNIPRGVAIGCPHIEKTCTAPSYSDRRLGASETVEVPSSVVHMFTGNNIGPRGDLASRSLRVRLDVDRPDPENRDFKHSDPVGWTEANRPRLLRALYTILLGNQALAPGSIATARTRFKSWWTIVGAAVEHAAEAHHADYADRVAALAIDPSATPPHPISFRDLFLVQDADDDESATLGEVLAGIAAKYGRDRGFRSADIAALLNDSGEFMSVDDRDLAANVRDVLYPKDAPKGQASSKSVGKALSKHIDNPVDHNGTHYVLKARRETADKNKAGIVFYVA